MKKLFSISVLLLTMLLFCFPSFADETVETEFSLEELMAASGDMITLQIEPFSASESFWKAKVGYAGKGQGFIGWSNADGTHLHFFAFDSSWITTSGYPKVTSDGTLVFDATGQTWYFTDSGSVNSFSQQVVREASSFQGASQVYTNIDIYSPTGSILFESGSYTEKYVDPNDTIDPDPVDPSDPSATNGLLSSILSALKKLGTVIVDGLLDGIKVLIIPTVSITSRMDETGAIFNKAFGVDTSIFNGLGSSALDFTLKFPLIAYSNGVISVTGYIPVFTFSNLSNFEPVLNLIRGWLYFSLFIFNINQTLSFMGQVAVLSNSQAKYYRYKEFESHHVSGDD